MGGGYGLGGICVGGLPAVFPPAHGEVYGDGAGPDCGGAGAVELDARAILGGRRGCTASTLGGGRGAPLGGRPWGGMP